MGKTYLSAAILAGAALLPAIALAEMALEQKVEAPGVRLVPPPANTGAVAPSEQAPMAREVKKDGQRLRCWQHGRLLYENTGFQADAQKQPNAVAIPRIDGAPLVVFDQKDAVCILSDK
jgi:hypothetical protein